MNDRLDDIFTNFANAQEDALKEMGMTKEAFIEQAKLWSETQEGKLEIQKFILEKEISELEKQVSEITKNINKKRDSINEIDEELSKL